jgi:hypothetical protein
VVPIRQQAHVQFTFLEAFESNMFIIFDTAVSSALQSESLSSQEKGETWSFNLSTGGSCHCLTYDRRSVSKLCNGTVRTADSDHLDNTTTEGRCCRVLALFDPHYMIDHRV